MARLGKVLCWLAPILALALAVLGWFVLPDTLVMQLTMDGSAGNALPKLWGLLIPLALVCGGCVWSRGGGGARALVVAGVGLLMDAFLFVVNSGAL